MVPEAASGVAFRPDPARPLAMLAACPAYAPTPLVEIGTGGISALVKDESRRMGLGHFKALGGVYAVACLVARAAEAARGAPLAPEALTGSEAARAASAMTFVTASAGNHGMAVAAGARIFGARARIHLAETVPEAFAARLAGTGCEVVRSGPDYEAAVAAAMADAEAAGATLLADGSWEGYTERPALVMEGYTVIAEEIAEVLERSGAWPDRVYLQAGVGGLAAAMAVRIRARWPAATEIVVVEPEAAACLAASAEAGAPVTVEGPVSSQGRLDCKAPSILAVAALAETAVRYAAVSDAEAEAAADLLAGAGMPTTPSGAAGLAALRADAARDERPARPLVIVTEGAL